MVLGRMVDNEHDNGLKISKSQGSPIYIMEILGLKVVMVDGGSLPNELKFEKMVDTELL
jgi:hypothetical protein